MPLSSPSTAPFVDAFPDCSCCAWLLLLLEHKQEEEGVAVVAAAAAAVSTGLVEAIVLFVVCPDVAAEAETKRAEAAPSLLF